MERAAARGRGGDLGVDRVSDLAGGQAQAASGAVVSRSPRTRNWWRKVIDVVGLYVAPPKGALVICVDERVVDEHGWPWLADGHPDVDVPLPDLEYTTGMDDGSSEAGFVKV